MKKTLLLLFVCLFVGISHAQAQVTVKGTVISSENNEPVIGASVLVKGTTNGTITDINGQFTLTNISPTNKTIIVSFIGMETQEVTIKPEMKIVMTSTTEVMEEVLVVAYGTAKKSAFTGSAKMIHTEQITVLRNKLTPLQIVITNGYTCSIFQVAKIAKKGVWLCSLFFKTIFRLIIDEVCIISTRYSASFS